MKAVIPIFFFFFISNGFAETRKALIYDIGQTKTSPQFTQQTEIVDKSATEKSWSSQITNAEGKVVMTEKATLKNGRTTYQYIEQLQINEAYELNVEGKKATFKTYKIVDGKASPATETQTHDIDDRFMTGPMAESTLQKNWSELLEGRTLEVEFGIFELSKVVSFEFKKINDDGKTVEVRMKPTNFFISMLVDPIKLYFDKGSKRLVRFVGRTPLQQKVETRWKALDAEIIYP